MHHSNPTKRSDTCLAILLHKARIMYSKALLTPVVPPTEPQGVLKDIVIDTASLGDDANSPITMALHGIIPTIDSYDSNGYILSHAPVYEF